MRKGCGRRRPAPVTLVGPRLRGRDDAVAALWLSSGGAARESIVVLVCDHEYRVRLAVELEGAPADGVATAVDLILESVPDAAKLVVGMFRAGGPAALEPRELEAVNEAASACGRHGVQLVDVIVMDGDRCRPVDAVAAAGYGDDNGDQ